MNEDLLKRLICAIEKDNCCSKPNKTSTRTVIDVTIERIKGSPGEKQLVVKYDDGSISTKQYTDTSEEGNTYLNKFKEVDGILIGTYNTGDDIQILNTRKFALQRDLRSLSKSIECLKGYSFEDVELDVSCDGSIQKSSCSRPFREGNSIYWINGKGEKEWLFDIPDTGCTSDDRFIIELTVSGNGSVNKELLVVRSRESALIEATPQPGHKFIGWYEDSTLISREASYSFVASRDIVLEARFASIPKFTVTATSNNTAYGTVSPATQTKEEGVAMTFVATPANPTSDFGYRFLRWEKNGSSISTNATLTITPTENFAVQAIFERIDLRTYYTHSVTQSTGGNISINPTGRQVANTDIVVTATPSSGYKLKNIKANNTVISSTSPFTHRPTANTVYIAEFEQCTTTTTFEIRGLAGRTGTINDSNPTATETFTFQVYKTVTGNCLLTPQVSEVTNYTYEVTGNPITNKQNGSFQTTAKATKTLTVTVNAEGKTVSKQVTFTIINNINPDKGAIKLNPTSPVGYTVTSDNATANVVNQCYIDGVGTAYTEVQIKLDTTKEAVLNWEIPTNVPSGAITITLNSDKSIATMRFNCKLLNGLSNVIVKLKDRLGRFISVILGNYKPIPDKAVVIVTPNHGIGRSVVTVSPSQIDPRAPQNVVLTATATVAEGVSDDIRYVFKNFTENGATIPNNSGSHTAATLTNVSTSRNLVAVYEKQYKITTISSNNSYGSVSPTETWVKEGGSVTFTATPTSSGVFRSFTSVEDLSLDTTQNPYTLTNVRSYGTYKGIFSAKPVVSTYDGIESNIKFLVCQGENIPGISPDGSHRYAGKIGFVYIDPNGNKLKTGDYISIEEKMNLPNQTGNIRTSDKLLASNTWYSCEISHRGNVDNPSFEFSEMFSWVIRNSYESKVYPNSSDGRLYPHLNQGFLEASCDMPPASTPDPVTPSPDTGGNTGQPNTGVTDVEAYIRSNIEHSTIAHDIEDPQNNEDRDVASEYYVVSKGKIDKTKVSYLGVGTVYTNELQGGGSNEEAFKQMVKAGTNRDVSRQSTLSGNYYNIDYSTGYHDKFRQTSNEEIAGIYIHYRSGSYEGVLLLN